VAETSLSFCESHRPDPLRFATAPTGEGRSGPACSGLADSFRAPTAVAALTRECLAVYADRPPSGRKVGQGHTAIRSLS